MLCYSPNIHHDLFLLVVFTLNILCNLDDIDAVYDSKKHITLRCIKHMSYMYTMANIKLSLINTLYRPYWIKTLYIHVRYNGYWIYVIYIYIYIYICIYIYIYIYTLYIIPIWLHFVKSSDDV